MAQETAKKPVRTRKPRVKKPAPAPVDPVPEIVDPEPTQAPEMTGRVKVKCVVSSRPWTSTRPLVLDEVAEILATDAETLIAAGMVERL